MNSLVKDKILHRIGVAILVGLFLLVFFGALTAHK